MRFKRSGSPGEQRGVLIQDPGVPLTSTVLLSIFGGSQTDSNVSVTPTNTFGISAVYRAVALLSGTVAAFPRRTFANGTTELVGAQAESAGDGQAPPILEQPHPMYTGYEFFELMMVHLCLWGNFYGLKVRDPKLGAQPYQVTPLMPWDVTPHWVIPEGKRVPTEKLYVWTLHDGTTVGLTSEDMFHVPGMGYDGLVGLAPLELFRQTYGLSIAAEKTGAKFFGSGNLMSGFLHTDKKLTETQAKGLKERWQERMAGVAHAGEVAVLDSGATFQSMMIPPEQAQFLQTREFEVLEIARIFGLPPHLLGAMTASTWGTGIEQLNMGLAQFGFTSWTSRIEGRVTKELLPPDQFMRFMTGNLTRGDVRSRYFAHLYARRAHIESINEIRAQEGLPPDPDPRADDIFYGEGEPGGVVGGDPIQGVAPGDPMPAEPGMGGPDTGGGDPPVD